MKQFVVKGIVLARTDYGEADRIITFLTPDQGKVKAYARAVRKSKSKLAGGIELFSVSDLTFVAGRGEINTLISSRLSKHFGNIVKDITRTQAAYEAIRMINKSTEDAAEKPYFELLESMFSALDEKPPDPLVSMLWFEMQLLKLSGHAPNLKTDASGGKLQEAAAYNFFLEDMRFSPRRTSDGQFTPNHIKFLRIGFAANRPQVLEQVEGVKNLAKESQPLIQTMLKSFVRI